MCLNLDTKQAANIFLNINSEQKPVPKSLIYDLFGLVEDNEDHVINRASDIARELNDSDDSPYHKMIKYPGDLRGTGLIDLSTVVSNLKAHLGPKGIFKKVNLVSLNCQSLAVINYLKAIKDYYLKENIWGDKIKNPFLSSAGFNGAMDYLVETLLTKCAEKKSFSIETFKDILRLDDNKLLIRNDLKDSDGRSARRKIIEFLEQSMIGNLPEQEEYEF
jgi:hypothetical protein